MLWGACCPDVLQLCKVELPLLRCSLPTQGGHRSTWRGAGGFCLQGAEAGTPLSFQEPDSDFCVLGTYHLAFWNCRLAFPTLCIGAHGGFSLPTSLHSSFPTPPFFIKKQKVEEKVPTQFLPLIPVKDVPGHGREVGNRWPLMSLPIHSLMILIPNSPFSSCSSFLSTQRICSMPFSVLESATLLFPLCSSIHLMLSITMNVCHMGLSLDILICPEFWVSNKQYEQLYIKKMSHLNKTELFILFLWGCMPNLASWTPEQMLTLRFCPDSVEMIPIAQRFLLWPSY